MRSLRDDLSGKTPRSQNPSPNPTTDSQDLQALLSSKTSAQRAAELEKQAAELLKQARAARTSEFEKFGKRYYDDPVAFAQDCINWKKGDGLTPYQRDILNALVEKNRVCVRTAHGAGKTMCASAALLWFSLTREAVGDNWKAICTASVGTQLRAYFWPEVKRWAKSIRWDRVGRGPFNPRNEMLTSELILSNGRAICVAPEDPAKAEGAHADQLFFVLDEAKSIEPSLFDALEGAFSGAGSDTKMVAYALMISTPGSALGRFYEINHNRERFAAWWCRHVRIEEILAAGRISQEFLDQKALEWGADSNVYRMRCLGEWGNVDDSALIPLDWVEAAFQRWEELHKAA